MGPPNGPALPPAPGWFGPCALPADPRWVVVLLRPLFSSLRCLPITFTRSHGGTVSFPMTLSLTDDGHSVPSYLIKILRPIGTRRAAHAFITNGSSSFYHLTLYLSISFSIYLLSLFFCLYLLSRSVSAPVYIPIPIYTSTFIHSRYII